MPFDKDTKAQMFINCARICCLCFKQCGTNIEAAHIIQEAKGGPNTMENGIPACMDCHTEISHYDDSQPKGNKFTPQELKARRDQVYALVKSGALQARIIASRLHDTVAAGTARSVPSVDLEPPPKAKPSKAASQVLLAARNGHVQRETLPRKLQLLLEPDQASVLDALLSEVEDFNSITALMAILTSAVLGEEKRLVLTEQALRNVALSNDYRCKASFMKGVTPELFAATDEGMRLAFFEEVIGIMRADQFKEVNAITPLVPSVQNAIPKELLGKYLTALIRQASSGANQGRPAAQRALREFPDDLAVVALETVDLTFIPDDSIEPLRELVKRTQGKWPASRKEILTEFAAMSRDDFRRKQLGI